MKAIVAPRINPKRTPLETVIPLDTPYVLFVDPSSRCNFRCKFCPTGDRRLISKTGRYQGVLSLDGFNRVMENIESFSGSIRVLRLYKDGEPLLNKDLSKMVDCAKQSDKIESVDTTTNGALLNPRRSERLIEAGIDRINISINGLSENQFSEFAGVKIDFDNILNNIKYLNSIKGDCQIVIKAVQEVIGKDQRQRFYDIFGDHCDQIYVENLSPCWPDFDVENRLGLRIVQGIYGNRPVDVDSCAYLFYSMSINSNLTVSACFLDWRHEMIVGDLRDEPIAAIWNGDRLNAHRWAHLKGMRRGHQTCGECRQLSHCQADNIDAHRDELVKRIDSPHTPAAQEVIKQYRHGN